LVQLYFPLTGASMRRGPKRGVLVTIYPTIGSTKTMSIKPGKP